MNENIESGGGPPSESGPSVETINNAVQNFAAMTDNYDPDTALKYLEQCGWDEMVLTTISTDSSQKAVQEYQNSTAAQTPPPAPAPPQAHSYAQSYSSYQSFGPGGQYHHEEFSGFPPGFSPPMQQPVRGRRREHLTP